MARSVPLEYMPESFGAGSAFECRALWFWRQKQTRAARALLCFCTAVRRAAPAKPPGQKTSLSVTVGGEGGKRLWLIPIPPPTAARIRAGYFRTTHHRGGVIQG